MSERAFRYDLVGTLVPPVVEDCAFCGAEVTLAGECSIKCEASRRKAKADEAKQERHG